MVYHINGEYGKKYRDKKALRLSFNWMFLKVYNMYRVKKTPGLLNPGDLFVLLLSLES